MYDFKSIGYRSLVTVIPDLNSFFVYGYHNRSNKPGAEHYLFTSSKCAMHISCNEEPT